MYTAKVNGNRVNMVRKIGVSGTNCILPLMCLLMSISL
ncbi:hypothetical protein BTN49_1054 [Candidatus Enterovibrio escicola]|uniref:Uncharacterized protein n=1 Tax=Candidatus Enterovibrio escicola TaxID=1927127 RepID=A0A2A5T4G7_9GAMM|nr:hypothetical protein BTN49_1054 [Candidatus Enterovibrio escacola]